ncbi:MAG: gliding motility protein GldN, partial [Chitinophagaceae bacterium]|nr:gliding motility protein GldN [Chitinophagaceae bacterium]
MKKLMILACSMVGLIGLVNAQSAYKKKAGNAPATNQPAPAPAAKQPAAARPNRGITQIGNAPAQAANANMNPAAAGNAAVGNVQVDTIPIEFDTTSRIQKPELSLRNPFATDRSQNRDRRPLEYEHLREDDNMWSEFIWREIDSREKINQSFNYPGADENGDRRFFSILINAIENDSIVAFQDDMFTRPFSSDKIRQQINGKLDTTDVTDIISGAIAKKSVSFKPLFAFDSVYTFRLKEQVLFDKEASRLFTRIIGIAPIAKFVVGGKSEPKALFWLYYPDLRRVFAKLDVYNPRNYASRMTWEELFESRYFSSYIVKTSANNPQNRDLLQIVNGDKLLRLYQGQDIKNRIF